MHLLLRRIVPTPGVVHRDTTGIRCTAPHARSYETLDSYLAIAGMYDECQTTGGLSAALVKGSKGFRGKYPCEYEIREI